MHEWSKLIDHVHNFIDLMTLYHNKMATGSLSDEWMYNEVLDEDLHSVRELVNV